MLEIQQKMHQVIGTAGFDIRAKPPVETRAQPVMTPSSSS